MPSQIRFDPNLTPGAKILLSEIILLSNNDKKCCWASNAYFAEIYSVNVSTIKRWLKELKDNGYIRTEVTYKKYSKEVDKRYIFTINPYDKGDFFDWLIAVKVDCETMKEIIEQENEFGYEFV